jgi:DNA-binding CsgD family transcriptional regulator
MGVANPGAIPALPDAIEALAHSGDAAGAAALLTRLEEQAAGLDSPWPWAAVERGRGFLLLSEGEADQACESLERATTSFDRLGYRLDAARAALAWGRARLRGGRRTVATEILADARDRFASMSAALWAQRAAQELERASPGRSAEGLTVTERRIARLVADGMKNRQIAEALFIGVATVEAHLTRIYRKLEIRSRSDLARLVADGSVEIELPEGA